MTNPAETSYSHETAEQSAMAFLETIVHAETLPALTLSFGVEMPEDLSTGDKLAWLKEFGTEHLDTRKGLSRQDAKDVEFTAEQSAAVMATATELSMQGDSEPTKKAYEFITIPGGANQSSLLRVKLAKEVLDSGVDVPYIIALGSSKVLGDKERANIANFAPGAETEFDAMNGAIEHEFGVTAQDEHVIDLKNISAKIMSEQDADFWKVRYYVAPNGTHILSVCAPLRDGHDSANTTDTYRFMREVVGPEMLEGKDVLNVTTDVFVPFQHVDALNNLGLPMGATVETIGYGGIDRPPSKYAQEINSAFRRGSRLHETLEAA